METPRSERAEAAGGSTYSAVPDAEAGRGQHSKESPLRVGLNVERRLGWATQGAEQPLGPAAQEIHGPHGIADARRPHPCHLGHTQRPRATRPPRTPPPAESAAAAVAARGICLLAGPGRTETMLHDEGSPAQTGPGVGDRKSVV